MNYREGSRGDSMYKILKKYEFMNRYIYEYIMYER